MSPIRPVLRGLLVATLAAGLAGCITLVPKAEPVGLYRFGAGAAPVAHAAGRPRVEVLKAASTFTRAAAGDRLLTITNDEAAYVADARWVSPASVLFDEALGRAFEADPGPARLIGRGEIAKADLILRLDVRAFETVYVAGPKAAPEVFVQVRAVLNRAGDNTLVGDQIFEARVKAGANRVGPIVAAYDEATTSVLSSITGWVAAAGPGVAR
jgi:cholesterol transport system auxiliary component